MELVVGILAAWGLIVLVWTLAGLILLPLRRRDDVGLTVLIRGKGQASGLEHYLRGLLWMRDFGLAWWNILVLEDELDRDALDRARVLTEKEKHVAVIPQNMLTDWMEV